MESTITEAAPQLKTFGSAVQSRLPLASLVTKQLNTGSVFEPYPRGLVYVVNTAESTVTPSPFSPILLSFILLLIFLVTVDYQRSLKMYVLQSMTGRMPLTLS